MARKSQAEQKADCRQKVDRMMPQANSKFRVAMVAAALGISVLATGCATKPDPSDDRQVQVRAFARAVDRPGEDETVNVPRRSC